MPDEVASATMDAASELMSVGRLRERSGICSPYLSLRGELIYPLTRCCGILGLMVLAAVAGCAFVPLFVLTAIGARRRGQPFPVAVLVGLFFPVTWLVWYVRDMSPYPWPRRRSQV